tara:strand:- start:1614 stop:1841 length:228 start_codon:yes stop_codon:yes gene_type:complete
LLVKRKTLTGNAMLYTGNTEFLSSNITFFLKQLPRDASIYGVKLDSGGLPTDATMDKIGERVVLVVVELKAHSDN